MPDPFMLSEQLEGMLGLATLPPKLMKRILNKEYIEMFEILPESWRLEMEASTPAGHGKRPRRGPITDIQVWCECYAVMAAALSAAYPLKAPHLFAYMRSIVRASRNFEGTAWVSYDMSYRRAAANKGSLDWGLPDPGRFNDAFVGRAKAVPRCSFCLSDTHVADSCPDAPAQSRPAAAGLAAPMQDWLTPARWRSAAPSTTQLAPAVSTRTVGSLTSATGATALIQHLSAENGPRGSSGRDPHWGQGDGSKSSLAEGRVAAAAWGPALP